MEDNTNINLEITNKIENIDLTTKYIMSNIQNSLILFCNPLSGNREGRIILDIASNYRTQENYRLIDFEYLNSKNKYLPIKVVIFELIDKEDNAKGQLLLKNCSKRCKQNLEEAIKAKMEQGQKPCSISIYSDI